MSLDVVEKFYTRACLRRCYSAQGPESMRFLLLGTNLASE
jgi:hypothetical protein